MSDKTEELTTRKTKGPDHLSEIIGSVITSPKVRAWIALVGWLLVIVLDAVIQILGAYPTPKVVFQVIDNIIILIAMVSSGLTAIKIRDLKDTTSEKKGD